MSNPYPDYKRNTITLPVAEQPAQPHECSPCHLKVRSEKAVLERRFMSNTQHTQGPWRTWDNGRRCAECCNGDRCDDPTHYSRENCPHCKGTGWALWSEAGRADYLEYLMTRRGMPEQDARAAIAKATGGAA